MRTRKVNQGRPISWYITWIIIDAIAIAIISCLILSLPLWQIKQVDVKGANYLVQDKIISTAQIPIGGNIFAIDMDEVKERLKKIVQIKEIKIKRKPPSTVVIAVIERKPFAMIVLGNSPVLVDDEGYIIARQNLGSSVYKVDVEKLPAVRGISKNSLEKGIKLGRGDLMFIKDTISQMSKFLDPGTIQIDISNREDSTIYIEDILKVKMGGPQDTDKKVEVLKALFNNIKGKWTKVAYIDVRVPDSPVIKFK